MTSTGAAWALTSPEAGQAHAAPAATGSASDMPRGKIGNLEINWCKSPTETAEFMKTVQKPWLAYKVIAAGAIPPADAFKYVLNNGADFVPAGMFDFEIAENARVFRDTLAAIPERPRPWRA